MTREQLETQLEKWKRILLVYTGAAVTLLVIALVELPANLVAAGQTRASFGIDGWYGVWLVLLLACLTPGIMLLLGPSWQAVPLSPRLGPGFGFLGSAWTALLAFDLRLAALDLPPLFHLAVAGFGLALLAAYLLLKRKRSRGEELFP